MPRQTSIPKRAHPLVQQLYRRILRRRAKMYEVIEASGVGTGTVRDWRTRATPNVANLDAVGRVVGLRLAWVEDDQ